MGRLVAFVELTKLRTVTFLGRGVAASGQGAAALGGLARAQEGPARRLLYRQLDLEDASSGSIALFGVLKVVEEIAVPLYKTVIVVYTEDSPAGADPHNLLENAVHIKTTSVLLQAPEADPDWHDAKEAGHSEVSIGGDSDEHDIF